MYWRDGSRWTCSRRECSFSFTAALAKASRRENYQQGELRLTMSPRVLAWHLHQKNVLSVIIGASRPARNEDNIAPSSQTLDAALLARIDAVSAV
jgi:aryl-alcohol dehydrogenase-like predicted oxidoreductase